MRVHTGPLKVYYCYAKQDEKLRDQLTTHLSPLRRERKLTIWLDVMIQPGGDWKLEVEKQLNEADIILLLISPYFIASDYCYNLQMMPALNLHEAGKVDIIPILLRPVLWEETPIKRLPIILPTSKTPVTLWPNRDEAFRNIAAGIRDIVRAELSNSRSLPSTAIDTLNQLGEPVFSIKCPLCGTPNRVGAKFCKNDGTDLISSKMDVVPKQMPQMRSKESWIEEGNGLYKHKQYIDALEAYQQALQIDPNDPVAHCNKGNAFYMLQLYPNALAAYEEALRLNPDDADVYCNKGQALRLLRRYREAIEAYEYARQLDPAYIRAYNGKGNVFYDLRRYSEAFAAYEQALWLNPSAAAVYYNKGNIFYELSLYSEALAAYEQARQLDPFYFERRKNKKSAYSGTLESRKKKDKSGATRGFPLARHLIL